MEKMLPEKMKMVYLIVGGLGVGLVFGASFLGKAAVYSHGAGVTTTMLDFYQTEKYLKELYGLESLQEPTRSDSIRAAEFYPGPDTLHPASDTLVNHGQKSQEEDPYHFSIHKPGNLSDDQKETSASDKDQNIKGSGSDQSTPNENSNDKTRSSDHH
jgi:hypothetical protein